MLDCLGADYTIGIVTNNFRQEQESKLADCGLTDAVDFMITSEETGIPKPSSAIFEAALERAGAEPAEAVMVGDSWSVDIVGALEAGIRPVWFNRHGRTAPDNLPVAQVRSYEPLEGALRVIIGRD
jgi:putative hydrolase of the HAD superfamily